VSPAVAVAVVSWNTRDLLAACLASLEPEVRAGRAEVWVVDNASSDGSAELVRSRFAWARLVASEENLGFGTAVNRVAAATDCAWIAPANADVAVEPGALETLLAAGAADPGAGALAPRLVLPDGHTQHSAYAFPTLAFTAVFNLGLHRVVPGLGDRLLLEGFWNAERARRVPWAIGALLLVRRTAWEAAGGFDEDQWMYAEDLDLGWRLARAGWATRYVPAARVRHQSSAATAQAWGDERTARWLASTYAWMLRRRGAPVTRAVAAVNIAGALARATLLAPAARIAPGRFAHARAANAGWARLHRIGLRPRRALLAHR
jgi:N-acetylglucosaminyl-diphospho-decaprenol L-rhamnosyltransferase